VLLALLWDLAMVFVLGRLQQEAGIWKKAYLRGRAGATDSFGERNVSQRFPTFDVALDALRLIEAQGGNAQRRVYVIESDPATHTP
jgi:hypothetical protein